MQLTIEEIEKAFQVGGVAIGGGAIWKAIDILIGRRKRRVDTDAVAMNSAVKLVQSLNQDIERLKQENSNFQEEKRECLEKFDQLRIELTDIKICMRTFYDHVQEHMRECKHPISLPSLPESLKK
jgi:FtsZ-binding cell division protein ZapB